MSEDGSNSARCTLKIDPGTADEQKQSEGVQLDLFASVCPTMVRSGEQPIGEVSSPGADTVDHAP